MTTDQTNAYLHRSKYVYRAYAVGFAIDAVETGNDAVAMAMAFCTTHGGFSFDAMIDHLDAVLIELNESGCVVITDRGVPIVMPEDAS